LRRELRAFDIDTPPFMSVSTMPGYASLLRAFIDLQKTAKASWSNASEVKSLAKEIARVIFKRYAESEVMTETVRADFAEVIDCLTPNPKP
jgi:hypothetical protein